MRANILGQALEQGSAGWHVLRDSILFAQAHLRTVLKKLGPEHKRKPADDLRSCLHHLENIASAANEGSLPNLHRLCEELWRHLKTLTVDNQTALSHTIQTLLAWTTDVLTHLDDPQNSAVVHRMLSPLPLEQQLWFQRALGMRADEPVEPPPAATPVLDELSFLQDTVDSSADEGVGLFIGDDDDFHPDLMPAIIDITDKELPGDMTQPLAAGEFATGGDDGWPSGPAVDEPLPLPVVMEMSSDDSAPDGPRQLLINSLAGGVEDFAEIHKMLQKSSTRQTRKDCRQALILLIDNIETCAVLAGAEAVAQPAGKLLDVLRHDNGEQDPMDAVTHGLPAWCQAGLAWLENRADAGAAQALRKPLQFLPSGAPPLAVAAPPPESTRKLSGADLPAAGAAPALDDDLAAMLAAELAQAAEPSAESAPLSEAERETAVQLHNLMAGDTAAPDTADTWSPETAADAELSVLGDEATHTHHDMAAADEDAGGFLISDEMLDADDPEMAAAEAAFNAALLAGTSGDIASTDPAVEAAVDDLAAMDLEANLGMAGDLGMEGGLGMAGDLGADMRSGIDEMQQMLAADLDDDDMEGILLPDAGAGDDGLAALADDDLDFAPDVDFSAEEGFAGDNILDVLRAELLEVSPQLTRLEATLVGATDAGAVQQAANSYRELTERLMLASESLGLSGLYELCRFVVENVAAIAGLDAAARQQCAPVLERWTGLVLAYLQNPSDDAGCVQLIDHFQNKAWPRPISGAAGRDLYAMLSKGMEGEATTAEPVPERQKTATAEDVALQISADASQDLIDAFFSEAPAQTERFSLTISLLAAGENAMDNIKVAQRIAHTLKGSGNLIGVRGLANLTHHVEDILEYLANHRMAPPASLADLLQETADCLEAMIDALQGKAPPPGNALGLLQRILDWANRVDKGQVRDGDLAPAASEAPATAAVAAEKESAGEADAEARASTVDNLRVPTSTVDDMISLLGEVSIAIAQVKEHINRLLQRGKAMGMQDGVIQQRRFDLENVVGVRSQSSRQRRLRMGGGASENFDPLEMDQYDELYGTAHSYIEAVADSREMSHLVQNELSTLEGLFLQQQRLNKELQQLVMSTRMESASSLSSRLQRAVRQACRATGKKVNLVIVNEDMQVDSDVLGKLADPMMHMLRNAVDHGIEDADTRSARGKPAGGTITLSYARQGNNVVVRCGDDGGGLNYEKIRSTAIKKGLMAEGENIEKRDLGRMILVPGFSTRDTTTQISGRGVGMDVVHATILELKGSLDIAESAQGGTEFVLRVPVSLVTNHSLVVKVGEELYAIPTNSLLQILAPDTGEVTEIGEEVAFQLGQDIYPARSLAALLNSSLGDQRISSKKIILLVKADTGNYAVTVDQLINSYELVVKSTGKYVRKVPGVAGVAVLGDGSVVPVLDLPQMLRSSTQTHGADVQAQPSVAKHNNSQDVLIVDDSLSVRKSLAQFVKDAGLIPVLARDGLEASEILRKQKVAVALVDMEMPRMNGLELTRHIRATEGLRDLPVIMITSRTQQKHRQQAEHAGVNKYLSKPYSEDDLLAAIEQLMGG